MKWGFRGGSQHEHRKEQGGLALLRFPGGVENKARGQKGLTEAPSGRPKSPGDIDQMGPGSRPPQNVSFSTGNIVFFKNPQITPRGGPEGVFPEIWGPRGGPGTPRGGRVVFRGGPRGPVGGPCEFRGGARGGPEAPVMTKPGYAYVFEVQRASRKHAKTNRKTWFLYMKCPTMTSPLFCAHAKRTLGGTCENEGNQGG